MPAKLSFNAYGKSKVRLTKVTRHGKRHDLTELSVDVQLAGDFADSYLTGDNSNVVATDSMKNTVYVLAKSHPVDSPESFAIHVAKHFTSTYKQVEQATITVEQTRWGRIKVGGKPHTHAFVGCGNEKHVSTVTHDRAGSKLLVTGGVADLLVLKTTGSEFRGYVRDEYTTLPETKDRIFATSIDATWTLGDADADFNNCYDLIRTALLETFADHHSLAVQQTLYAMAEAALDACPEVESIRLGMPNKHRLLVDLKPFGLQNQNEIFVPTDEPHGNIIGYVERDRRDTSKRKGSGKRAGRRR
jgi:urate oxidase